MIEAILEKIEAKPDLQILKLTPDEAKTLHTWLGKYIFMPAGKTFPPFEVWIQKCAFLNRIVEVVEPPKPTEEEVES